MDANERQRFVEQELQRLQSRRRGPYVYMNPNNARFDDDEDEDDEEIEREFYGVQRPHVQVSAPYSPPRAPPRTLPRPVVVEPKQQTKMLPEDDFLDALHPPEEDFDMRELMDDEAEVITRQPTERRGSTLGCPEPNPHPYPRGYGWHPHGSPSGQPY